jgi:hypothetical protein
MSLTERAYGSERARPLARESVGGFPHGAYERAARALLSAP